MDQGKRLLLILLSFAWLSSSVLSVSLAQVPTGKIFGTVADEQGNPLPGVSVEATSPSLVGRATAVTDVNGVYRLFALTPGTYKVSFALQGFKAVVRTGIVAVSYTHLTLPTNREV